MGTVLVISRAARRYAGPPAMNTDTLLPMTSATIGWTFEGSPPVNGERLLLGTGADEADLTHGIGLRMGSQGPWQSADEELSQLPSFHHSITSSARTRIDCGTVRPSALAVFMLTTSSNVVGCTIGRAAGG